MCGIFGVASCDLSNDLGDVSDYQYALNLLDHRGPDNTGTWSGKSVFFGHKRLSIIELSDSGNQPFSDPSNLHHIVFNGEIYNYIELRLELKKHGWSFLTNSDTEVVLAALVIWGENALIKFDGMFSGAYYDMPSKRLILFRDYLGQKPLYWSIKSNKLLFSSELRSILMLPGAQWVLNKIATARYLLSSYYSGDDCPVEGVYKLRPGTFLELKNGEIGLKRYWDSIPGEKVNGITSSVAVEKFDTLFDESCHKALRADVPVGILLSGGVDSSLVLESCLRSNSQIDTFTVKVDYGGFDESQKASMVIKHLGIKNHHVFTLSSKNINEAFHEFLTFSDEPHGDPGFINSYFLTKNTAHFVKVALSGDGGDELFAGYEPFLAIRAAKIFQLMPASLQGLAKSIGSMVPASDRYVDLRFKLDHFFRGFPAERIMLPYMWLSATSFEGLERIFDKKSNYRIGKKDLESSIALQMTPVRDSSFQQQLLYFYQKIFLPEFICMHTDRASMQSGLEVRSPFLSKNLIEFANGLPDSIRMKGNVQKYILRNSARNRGLPIEICNQSKQGFTFPVALWLRGILKHYLLNLADTQSNESFNNLIDQVELIKIVNEHLAGHRNHYRLLLNLISLKAWLQKFSNVSVA